MFVWQNIHSNEIALDWPNRVRLPDGMTRTSTEITPELLMAAGWVFTEIESTANAAIQTGNIGN